MIIRIIQGIKEKPGKLFLLESILQDSLQWGEK